MKKLLTIAVAAMMVFAIAGTAAAEVQTSGEYRARFWYLDSYLVDGKSTEFFDQRLRLGLKWDIAEGVVLSARADILEGLWGDNLVAMTQAAVPADPATGAPAVPAVYTAGSNTRPAVAWDQVNLMFKVPNSGVAITVGRQPAAWGTGLFVAADNRDRFKATAKFGDWTALYTFDKYTEVGGLHDIDSLGDRSQHSVGAVGKAGGFGVGIIGGVVLDDSNVGHDLTLYAVDAYLMGKAGPADLKLEVAYATGTDEHDAGDVDLSGLLAYLGLSMPAGPAKLSLEGVYVQGDADGPGGGENKGALAHDYQGPFWSVILFNNMDYQGYDKLNNIARDTSVANAYGAKVTASMNATEKLNVMGAVVWASRDKVAAGVDKDLGIEIDVVAAYSLNEVVKIILGGGYLMAGDYYGDVNDPWGAMLASVVNF